MEITTSPIEANALDLKVHIMARAHDSLAVLARRLCEIRRRHGWSACVGRVPDGRPTCLEFVSGRASLTLYPSDNAMAAHDLAKAGLSHDRSDLVYDSISQCPWTSMPPAMRCGLYRLGTRRDGHGVMTVACRPRGVELELSISALRDLLDAVGHANRELLSLRDIAV